MDDYLKELVQDSEPLLKEDACAFEVISKKAPECIPQMFYLKQAGFPVYQNTRCTYFPSGESVFPDICEEIQKAGKYIFLEFLSFRKAICGIPFVIFFDTKGTGGCGSKGPL